MRNLLIFGFFLIVIGLGVGGSAWYIELHRVPVDTFRKATIKRADLVATISATGTAEPEEVVDIGAQVAGQILYFGKDKSGKLVDYGSEIDADTVLAKIDDSLYAADVETSKATVAHDQAMEKQAEANLGQMKATLYKADRDWTRAQKLGPSEALAQTDYDGYQSANEIAKANVAVAESAILAAKATISQDQAVLNKAQKNLDYCTITSPVKGLVIDRRVNIGETVVSSLNAPSLFLIAKDLHQMQVWVSVNEADIGSIHPGQPVAFTVDAFPGQNFVGVVGKIRLNAAMTQNVVTYTVEVETDNSSGKLLPYLTCNVQFEVARHKDVMQVPNAALRWNPSPDQIAPTPETQEATGTSETPDSAKANESSSSTAPDAATQDAAAGEPKAHTHDGAATRPAHSGSHHGDASTRGTIWVLTDGNLVRKVSVRVGLSDGTNTEIHSKDLKEGDTVVVGEFHLRSGDQSTTNPFMPQIGRPRSANAPSGGGSGGGSSGGGSPR